MVKKLGSVFVAFNVSRFIVLYVIDDIHSVILESVFHLNTLKRQDVFKIPKRLHLVCVP